MQLLAWAIHKAYDTWVAWQVELHGQFSLERMRKLEAFAQRTSLPRAMLIGSLTPIPCLVLISLIDAVPLASPNEGTNANYVHWIRNYLTIVFMSYAILEQFRYTVPGLPLSLCRLNAVALLASLGGVGFQFVMSHAIGFPLPFSIVVGTPVWTVVIVTLFWIYFAAPLRANEQLQTDLTNYMHVFFCQVALTFIYPAYVYGFQSIDPEAQQFYVVLLPLLKIALKNWISRSLGELDDMKPEIAIFNVELFNALYLACCVQRSRSVMTTLVVSCGDWFVALLSFRDITVKHRAVVQFMDTIPHDHAWHGKSFAEVARLVVDEDAAIREHPSLKTACTSSGQEVFSFAQSKRTARAAVPRDSAMVVPVIPAALVPSTPVESGPPSTLTVDAKLAPSEPETASASETLAPSDNDEQERRTPHFASRDERLQFVRSVLQLLFTTEFVILLEYTIVFAPTIYSIYIAIAFHMKNRVYYTQLAHIDEAELERTISNIVLYGGLQFVALAAMSIALKLQLRVSVFKQAAFVLTNQWSVVHWKVVLWFFYCVQNSLDHFGADYSFQFAWLKGHSALYHSPPT